MTATRVHDKLLLIEDNLGDARLIAETLKDIPGTPFELDHVTRLADGLAKLQDEDFHLLLLDLGLPDSQGQDTLLKVREVAPDLAVVILTGLEDETVAAQTVRLGAQDYLSKGDIEPRQINRALRYAIERKQIENALRGAKLKEEMDRQEERERIGMDLHDGITQDIYGIGLLLENILDEMKQEEQVVRPGLEKAIARLHGVIHDMRSYIFDLRPRSFDGDLESALRNLASEFHENSNIETTVNIEGELRLLATEREMALYHIAHEALSNARKHAKPNLVAIKLSCTRELVILEVRDDGVGFDSARDLPEHHRGMRNMLSRARTVGGVFTVDSVLGNGTSIRVEVSVDGTVLPVTPHSGTWPST